MSDREKAQEICELTSHYWVEEYYGIRCEQCGLFYPDGLGPWMPLDDDDGEPDDDDWPEDYYWYNGEDEL